MNLHVNKALISAMSSLNMTEDALLKEREYTIIEFFRDYLKLPLNETIDLSKDLVNELPVVCINEWDLTRARTTAANIGNAIKASSNGTNPQGNAITYPKASNPISRMGQSVGNAFGSKMSTINNSPMIRVGDASGYKFLTFPDLDASRKGHDVILNKIIAGLTTSGKQAEVVKVGSNEWNTAKQSKELVKVEAPNKNDNNKANVIKVLDDLNQLVAQKKAIVNKYSFMSPEELADIQAEIQTKVGGATAALANAGKADQAQETTALTQAATQVVAQTPAAPPAANPGGLPNFYQAGMTGQPQQTPSATVSAQGSDPRVSQAFRTSDLGLGAQNNGNPVKTSAQVNDEAAAARANTTAPIVADPSTPVQVAPRTEPPMTAGSSTSSASIQNNPVGPTPANQSVMATQQDLDTQATNLSVDAQAKLPPKLKAIPTQTFTTPYNSVPDPKKIKQIQPNIQPNNPLTVTGAEDSKASLIGGSWRPKRTKG